MHTDLSISVSISPSGVIVTREKDIVFLNCIPGVDETLPVINLFGGINGVVNLHSEVPFVQDTVNNIIRYSFGPVDKSQNGTVFECRNFVTGEESQEAVLFLSSIYKH